MRKRELEKQEAMATFVNAGVKPGSVIYTILRHVSKSGMQREISLVFISSEGEKWDCTWAASRLLGMRVGKREGIVIRGCGMDMGFALVYDLAWKLFPTGFRCLHLDGATRCPSNDHTNGKETERHTDGGYALRHRWM